MIRGLDSSADRPTPAILTQARAAGVQVWGGYLVSASDADVLAARNRGEGMFGLAAPWTVAEFGDVLDAGLRAIGFCSGWDFPAQVGAKARANGILACLDDEDGIRAVAGGWQQRWLDAAQAGHYGNVSTDVQVTTAPFHIIAEYPGADPGAVWPAHWLRPPGPVGWQWQGSHQEFGITVDSLWLDDWFAPSAARGEDVVFDSRGVPHQSFVAPAAPDGTRHVFHGWGDLGASGVPANGGLQDWGGDGVPFSERIGIAPNGDVWIDVAGPTGLVFRNVNGAGWTQLSGAAPITVALPPAAGTLVAHTHPGGETGPAQAS